MKQRLNYKKRHIAPALIGTAISTGLGLVQSAQQQDAAIKAREEMINQMLNQKASQDAIELDEYDTTGNTQVEYYARGGRLPNISNKGKFQTTGGELKSLSSRAEVAEGNTHGENTIDGQYGITLEEPNGNPVAEVEDEEVIVDNQKVFSDRLKASRSKTFAQVAKSIATKAGKLESKLEGSTDSKDRNGIERNLAGMKMAEDALYAKQEAVKIEEGNKELAKVMAYGGPIVPPPVTAEDDGTLPVIDDPLNPLSQWYKSNPALFQNNAPAYTPTPYTGESVSLDGPIATAEEGSNVAANDKRSLGSYLAPMLIDNVANAGINAFAPRLPKPIPRTTPRIETKVNVAPQLAAINDVTDSASKSIIQNTSNSNTARNLISGVKTNTLRQKLEVLGAKENAESQLRNQNTIAKNRTDNYNADAAEQFSMRQFQRANDIQSRASENIADISKNIGEAITFKQLDGNNEETLLLELLNDTTGEKAKAMSRNPYIMRSPKLASAINAEINRKKSK